MQNESKTTRCVTNKIVYSFIIDNANFPETIENQFELISISSKKLILKLSVRNNHKIRYLVKL